MKKKFVTKTFIVKAKVMADVPFSASYLREKIRAILTYEGEKFTVRQVKEGK